MSNIVSSSDKNMNRSKARRCLFGPVDHDILRKDLDSMLKLDKRPSKSFDFDFDTGIPVSGGDRYEWTEITPASNEYVPEYYKKGYTPRVPPTPRKLNIQTNKNVSVMKKPTAVRQLNLFRDCMEISGGEDNASSSVSIVRTASPTFNPIQPPSTPSRTARSRRSRIEVGPPLQAQSRISDFMAIRKRRHENDSLSNSQRKLPRI